MDKIRYGVVGLKGVGRHHVSLAAKNDEIELVALADVDESVAHAEAERYGVRWYTSCREMLEDDSVDAVSIAVPHNVLSAVAEECLAAGKHIFLEKPGSITVGEIEQVLRAARDRGLKICVGFQQRTHRKYRLMNELIEGGRIGRLQQVLWTWNSFRPNSFFDHPWRSTWHECGGGLLISQISHDLDVICWLAGRPRRVSAMMKTALHDVETEDVAAAVVEFDNGAIGSLQFSMNGPEVANVRHFAGDQGILLIRDVKSLTHDVNEEVSLGVFREPAAASLESIKKPHGQPSVMWKTFSFPETSPRMRRLMRPSRLWRKLDLPKRPPPWHMGHGELMASLVAAIRNGSDPIATGEDAKTAVELRNAMVVSSITGRMVDLPLDPKEVALIYRDLGKGALDVPDEDPR